MAFRASMAKIVDWYRLRQSRALLRAFLPGALLLPLGNLLIAASMARSSGLSASLRPGLAVLGLCVSALGPLWAMWQLFLALRGDLYVAIRVDGLGVRLDPKQAEAVYAWERVQEISFEPDGKLLRIDIDSHETLLIRGPFAEIGLDELARRIRDARRLAVWNRLVPRFPVEPS